MLIIGIDPGISGSICFFKDGRILEVIEMPVMTEGKKNKKQVNGAQIYNEFLKKINNKDNDVRVVIEQVSAMPGQGVTSMFNFGQSYGILKGICSAMQLPMFFVRPTKWKKYFNLINSQKDASRTKAIEIFPYFSTQLSKKKAAITIYDDQLIFNKPSIYSKPYAILKKGRLCRVHKCKEEWCKISVDKYKGWVKKDILWGLL